MADLHAACLVFDTSNPQAETPFALLICILSALLTNMPVSAHLNLPTKLLIACAGADDGPCSWATNPHQRKG